MEHSGLNVNNIKERNDSSVLYLIIGGIIALFAIYLINYFGETSRKDIAEKLSLTEAAVSKICSRLIDKGLIEETNEKETYNRAGRKKVMLRLRLSQFYALGINAESDKITLSIVCLDGTSVLLQSVGINTPYDKIIKSALELMEKSEIEKNKILCAAICLIGAESDAQYGLWSINEIKSEAEKILKLPVISDNNVRAFALSEIIYGQKKIHSPSLLLKWGPGIASAILTDGGILAGKDPGVTEIGHYIVRRDGKKCRCGRYGCLETEASTTAICKEVGDGRTIEEIIESSDNEIRYIIDEKTDLVALALANTATILNADRVILFGTMFFNTETAKKLIRQCGRYNFLLTENKIELSSLNSRMTYIGAVALAAKHFFFEKQKIENQKITLDHTDA